MWSISIVEERLLPGSELCLTLTQPGRLTRGPDVYVYGHGRVVRTEIRTEDGAQRVGIAASIKTYDFTRVEPSSH
jgi:hypothetical protein